MAGDARVESSESDGFFCTRKVLQAVYTYKILLEFYKIKAVVGYLQSNSSNCYVFVESKERRSNHKKPLPSEPCFFLLSIIITIALRLPGLHSTLSSHICTKHNNLYWQMIARLYITHCIQIVVALYFTVFPGGK